MLQLTMNLLYIEDLLSIIDPVVAIEYFILKIKVNLESLPIAGPISIAT